MIARPLTVAGVLAAATVLVATGAQAAPLDQGKFHDVFTSDVYDCDGTPVQDDVDVQGSYLFNLRGSSPYGYYRESIHGSVVHRNLENGGTFTTVFSTSTKDQKITDNGDGTIRITDVSAGGFRAYDTHGRLVLKDPGNVLTVVDIDVHGTPNDVSDDTEVPGSFQVLRPSTGNSDFSGRSFCDDLRLFTS